MMPNRLPSYSFTMVCPNYEPDPTADAAEFTFVAEGGEAYKFVWVPSGDSFTLSFELPGRSDICLRTAKHIGQLGLKEFGIVETTITQAFVTTDVVNPEYPGQTAIVEYTDELFLIELDDAA